LTRSNLTAAERRIRELETAFGTLFPGIDLETVLSSIRPGNPYNSAIKNATQSSNGPGPLPVQESHEPNSATESLPREADGFDWTENAVNLSEISDGMAALSINPEGAGYLGKQFE
jgi:transcriptional regulatory protein GAL4